MVEFYNNKLLHVLVCVVVATQFYTVFAPPGSSSPRSHLLKLISVFASKPSSFPSGIPDDYSKRPFERDGSFERASKPTAGLFRSRGDGTNDRTDDDGGGTSNRSNNFTSSGTSSSMGSIVGNISGGVGSNSGFIIYQEDDKDPNRLDSGSSSTGVKQDTTKRTNSRMIDDGSLSTSSLNSLHSQLFQPSTNSTWNSKIRDWFIPSTTTTTTTTSAPQRQYFPWILSNRTESSNSNLNKSDDSESTEVHSTSTRFVPDVSDMRCFPEVPFHACVQLCFDHADQFESMGILFPGEQGPSMEHSAIPGLERCLNDCRSEYIESPIPGCVNRVGKIIPGAPLFNDGRTYPEGIRKPGTFPYYFNRWLNRFFEDQVLQQLISLLIAAAVLSGLVLLCIHQSEVIVGWFPAVEGLIVSSRLPELVNWILEKARAATRSSSEENDDRMDNQIMQRSATNLLAEEVRQQHDASSSLSSQGTAITP